MTDEAWSWTGKTQAGRTLRLSGPQGTLTTAVLDGEPIEVTKGSYRWNKKLGEGYLVQSAAGTFTAIADDADPELHSVLLRKYINARPTDGWQITLTRSWEVDGEHRFAFEVSSEWRSATLELYLAPSVVKSWLDAGGSRTLEEMATQELANSIKRADWPEIDKRSTNPTTVLRSDFPPDRY